MEFSEYSQGQFLNRSRTPLFRPAVFRLGWIVFFLVLPFSGWSKEQNYRFNEIRVKDGKLKVHFFVGSLLNRDVFNSLQKGMTAAVEYQIQLWKEQKNWVDQLVTEEFCRMKIGYDSWEKRYILTLRDGTSTLVNEDGVWEHCAKLSGFPLADAEKLEANRRYRIVIRITFQPMSIENVEDIKRWLSGEAGEINPKAIQASKSPLKKAGDWMVGLVVNLSGFGDKVILAQSQPFLWQDGLVVVEKGK